MENKPIKICKVCGKDSTKVKFRRKRAKCRHCENNYQKEHLEKKKAEQELYYY